MNSISHKLTKVQMALAGLIPLDVNVEIVHRDKDGNIKAIFQENALAMKLIKSGMLSPAWINAWYAPILSPFLGHWSDKKYNRNLVPTAGKAAVASRINGNGAEAVFDKIGWGTGTTSPAAGNTALEAEKDLSGGASTTHVISAPTVSRVTTTVTNDTAQWVGTATASGTIAVTESGVFNAASAGTLLCRQTFTAINVVSGDSIQFTWKVACA